MKKGWRRKTNRMQKEAQLTVFMNAFAGRLAFDGLTFFHAAGAFTCSGNSGFRTAVAR